MSMEFDPPENMVNSSRFTSSPLDKFLGILVLAAFGLLVWAGWESVLRFRFGTPVPVPAKVLHAKMRESSWRDNEGDQHTSYFVLVRFSYDSPRGSGESSRWSATASEFNTGTSLNGWQTAKSEYEKWPVGRTFTAYQSEKEPDYVVICNPAENRELYLGLAVFGLVLAAVTGPIVLKRRQSS